MENKRNHTVTIFGDQYNLVTDEPESYIYHAAQEVDRSMRSIAEKSTRADIKKVAVLVALQAMCKLVALENAQKDEKLQCKELINSIDRQLSSILS
jgi:cell division protein ZapA (FtsZ GTPase activity inhibitor)